VCVCVRRGNDAVLCQITSTTCLARSAAAYQQRGGLFILLWFLIYLFIYLFILNDFCQTNYLKIYRTDLRQILGGW